MTEKNLSKRILSPFLLSGLLILNSCSSMPDFSQKAYSKAVRLKIQSLDLMDKATEGYSKHSDEVDSLKTELRFAYEYAKGRPDNELITEKWDQMINPERNLIGGFLKIWKEDLILSPIFVSEAQVVIGKAFDTIIELESGKIKPSQIQEEN